jgi:hypothetical protein
MPGEAGFKETAVQPRRVKDLYGDTEDLIVLGVSLPERD